MTVFYLLSAVDIGKQSIEERTCLNGKKNNKAEWLLLF